MQTLKKNYQAWAIDHQEFYVERSKENKLRFLARFGILAPSSHNCQPWKVRIENEALYIFAAEERELSVSDKNKKHLYTAIGAFIENICVAGNYYKHEVEVTYFPPENHLAIAKITLSDPVAEKKDNGDDHLIFEITKRRSNRNPYGAEVPSADLLKQLKAHESSGLSITLFSDPEDRKKLARLLVDFREDIFSESSFRAELSRYKRTNFTRDHVGMPGFTMGFPNLISLIVPTLIRYINVMKLIKEKDTALIAEHTPVAGVISVREETPLAWLAAGRILERVLLLAGQAGFATSLSAVPSGSEELRALIPSEEHPVMFFRIGRAMAVPEHSPRLSVEQIIM